MKRRVVVASPLEILIIYTPLLRSDKLLNSITPLDRLL